jgi:hypothetical protein
MRLSVIFATHLQLNLQLKDLTHLIFLQIPCYKLYKEGLFFYILTLKYKCDFGMNSKKLNLKAKDKIHVMCTLMGPPYNWTTPEECYHM